MGDGLLAEFPNVVEAMRCAVEIRDAMAGRDPHVPEVRRIAFRVGVNLGGVIVGAVLNVAANHLGPIPPREPDRRRVMSEIRSFLDSDTGERSRWAAS